jgi:hypothetical protein
MTWCTSPENFCRVLWQAFPLRTNGVRHSDVANQAWWLDPLEFSRPEFDADKYVANLRKNVRKNVTSM